MIQSYIEAMLKSFSRSAAGQRALNKDAKMARWG